MTTIIAEQLERERDEALLEMGNAIIAGAPDIYAAQAARYKRATVALRDLRKNAPQTPDAVTPPSSPSTPAASGAPTVNVSRREALRVARDLVQADMLDWGARYAGGAHIGNPDLDAHDRAMLEHRRAVVRRLNEVLAEVEG